MNREQRRNAEKKLRSRGFTKTQAKKIVAFEDYKQGLIVEAPLKEGDLVKLNYDIITSSESYVANKDSEEAHVQEYHRFVEDNKDAVFHVEFDTTKMRDEPYVVCLREDQRERKWLWFFGDLVKVSEEGEES